MLLSSITCLSEMLLSAVMVQFLIRRLTPGVSAMVGLLRYDNTWFKESPEQMSSALLVKSIQRFQRVFDKISERNLSPFSSWSMAEFRSVPAANSSSLIKFGLANPSSVPFALIPPALPSALLFSAPKHGSVAGSGIGQEELAVVSSNVSGSRSPMAPV